MAQGLVPEEIKILRASEGSVILVLVVVYAFADTIGEIILKGLRIAGRVLYIKKKAEELKTMKLINEQIVKDLSNYCTTPEGI